MIEPRGIGESRLRAKFRRAPGVVIGIAGCLLAVAVPSAAVAATQSLQVTAAPGAVATRPEAITATGQVGVASTITIYAQFGAVPCAAQTGEEAARGATQVDSRVVNGPFSYGATFTPAAAGTYYICTYLDGAAPGVIEHQNQAFAISVGPAPPGPPPPAPPVTNPRASACVVPPLKRHTLGGAQHLLAVAGCKLGRVYRPSARTLRAARRRAGGRPLKLVVVSQTPVAGTVRVVGYTVAVRLAVSTAPRARRTAA
jgi:hypothetical protein